MSNHKDDKKQDYKNIITSLIKKREHDYNHMSSVSSSELNKLYSSNVIVYSNLDKELVIGDKKKAMEIEKKIFTNNSKNHSIKISHLTIHEEQHFVTVSFKIYFNEVYSNELQQMIQKLTIKDVNMEELMNDLNQNGVNVHNLLTEFNKNGKKLDSLLEYLNRENIGLSNIMTILYRNNVTINGLIQNEFIHDLIKQSPTYAWFLQGKELPAKAPKSDVKTNKILNKIHVYAIYKVRKDEVSLININWNRA